MAEESDSEKTEQPSERRLEQAREEGQVPRSRELGSFLMLLSSAVIFSSIGPWMTDRMADIVKIGLSFDFNNLADANFVGARLIELSIAAIVTILPLMAAVVLAIFAAPFMMRSWNFSTKALMPDIARFNIVKGLGRIISKQGFAELVKSIAKVLVVGGASVWVMLSSTDEIFAIFFQPLDLGLIKLGSLLSSTFLLVVLSMLLIVGIDIPYQIWSHLNKLKMTKDEVKQEYKQSEGSPEVKGRIRQLQREAAMRRMMSSIPQADVVVTNPTHVSIALSYQEGMRAPKVVAKGMGQIALKIRELAAEHGIPMLEAPPLARALYKHAEIDDEIPSKLYAAVAEVLAYVYQLTHWKKGTGEYPSVPRHIAVPEELAVESVDGQ